MYELTIQYQVALVSFLQEIRLTLRDMRKFIILLASSVILACSPMLVSADQPPDPGGGPGGDDQPVGGGSPVGGSLIILATLGVAYGVKRIYDFRNSEHVE